MNQQGINDKAVWLRRYLWRGVLCGFLLAEGVTGVQAAELPSPVYFANQMEMGNLDQARAWLDSGMPADFEGSRIGTGLMIAAWEGNLPLMELFLSRGANINASNSRGEQALLMAAWNGKLEAVQWLVARGAQLNRPGLQWNALHYAAFNGHQAVVDWLLAQGADINARSPNGSSVLMLAIYEGKVDLARHLLQNGANPRIRNDRNDSALEWAMRYNHTDIARQLVSAEEFAEAASRPKSDWGDGRHSEPPPPEIARLLKMREQLVARGVSPEQIDRNITLLRARHANIQLRPDDVVTRNPDTLEISARRSAPQQQRAVLVRAARPAATFRNPPATIQAGQARMPVRAGVPLR